MKTSLEGSRIDEGGEDKEEDGSNWSLAAFTWELCSPLSWFFLTVNLIGVSLTLETHLWVSVKMFPRQLTEERKTRPEQGQDYPLAGVWNEKRRGVGAGEE